MRKQVFKFKNRNKAYHFAVLVAKKTNLVPVLGHDKGQYTVAVAECIKQDKYNDIKESLEEKEQTL